MIIIDRCWDASRRAYEFTLRIFLLVVNKKFISAAVSFYLGAVKTIFKIEYMLQCPLLGNAGIIFRHDPRIPHKILYMRTGYFLKPVQLSNPAAK